MASPLFDSNPIFDSTDDVGGHFTEGVLSIGTYTKIRQKLHFNGEQGDRYLFHGWGDRDWEFKGILSANTTANLWTNIQQIESYVDQCDESTYFALTDSFGNTWTSAQILSFTYTPPHKAATVNTTTNRRYPSYICEIVVKGIIVGMQQEA